MKASTPESTAALSAAQMARAEPQVQPLTEQQPYGALFRALRAWRTERARQMGRPAYLVLHDSVLQAIASALPRTLEALRQIRGIGPVKLEAYGQEILAIVASADCARECAAE